MSPDDITISKAKKLKAKTPLVRKGRKTPLKKVLLKKATTKDANFEGLAAMLKTPAKALKKATTPKKATPKSSVKKTPKAATPKTLKFTMKTPPAKATTPKSVKKATPKASPKSVKKATPKVTPKSVKKATPKATPKSAKKATPKATPKSATPKATPKSTKKSNVTFNTSAAGTPNLDQTAFDFDSIKTPNVPLETFVSPLDSSAK